MSFATRLAKNDVQEEAIAQIEKWLKKLGKQVVGGTAIGKYYDTVILDLTYNGGEIYVHSNGFEDTDHGYEGVTVNDVHIKDENCFLDFKNAVQRGECMQILRTLQVPKK